ncbi:MAG: DUF4867 family protein [Lachnospiraceae bacterium]|nr:DUF4867 family protein [Lachnospiraceae bacterium]
MKIYDVSDPLFAEYGQVLKGLDEFIPPILEALEKSTPLPEATGYVPSEPALQNLDATKKLAPNLFGDVPTQFGWCNGHNTKLNCFEYHRNSEFSVGTEDYILLLARQQDLKDGHIDSSKTVAFKVPKGTLVEIYGTSLHYAPCHADPAKGFKVMIALPEGTNTGALKTNGSCPEDRFMTSSNKWLIAHADAPEAKDGAFVGIDGDNIDIAPFL